MKAVKDKVENNSGGVCYWILKVMVFMMSVNVMRLFCKVIEEEY